MELRTVKKTLTTASASLLRTGVYTAIILASMPAIWCVSSGEEVTDDVRGASTDTIEISFRSSNGRVNLKINGTPEIDLPTPEAELERRITSLDSTLRGRFLLPGESVEEYQRRSDELESAYWREAHALSDRLLGAVSGSLGGKRLVVAADGPLNGLSLAALPPPFSTANEPLIVTNEVVYRSHHFEVSRNREKAVEGMLIVADPMFTNTASDGAVNEESELRSYARGYIPPLPGSAAEANSIQSFVGAGNVRLLTGSNALRGQLVNADLGRYSALHLATHGFFDAVDPENSGILLSDDPNGPGSLRISDVRAMDLDTDLVVLSGCETGKGVSVDGEMISLKSAFLDAGAKTVVSSLWNVDDTATNLLMTNFYRNLAVEGLAPAAALRNAQVSMFRDPRFASPFYWGAFTVEGEAERSPQFQHRSSGNRYEFSLIPIAALFPRANE